MDIEAQQCTDTLIAWLISGSARGWLENLYWAGGFILAVIAVFALRTRAKHAKASFLLELDSRWDNLFAARNWVAAIRLQIMQEIGEKSPLLDEKQRKERARDAFTNKLDKLHAETNEKYRHVLELSGFFETVGLMVIKGYVKLGDVVALLKGPILNFEVDFSGHIANRQKEMHMPTGLFENALALARMTRKKEKITQP